MGIQGPDQSISFYIGSLHFVNWRLFLIICTLPALLSALSLTIMPESPAYLLHVGCVHNARCIISVCVIADETVRTAQKSAQENSASEQVMPLLFDCKRGMQY